MLFIRQEKLKEGMRLAKPIYNKKGVSYNALHFFLTQCVDIVTLHRKNNRKNESENDLTCIAGGGKPLLASHQVLTLPSARSGYAGGLFL